MFVVRLISICWRMRTKRAMNSGVLRNTRIISFFSFSHILFSGHNQVISNSNSMQQLQPDDTRQRTRTRHQAETSPVAEDFDEVFHPERPNTMDGTLTPVSDLTEMSETQLTTRSVTQTGEFFIPLQYLQFFLRNWPRIESSRRWTK